MVLHDEILVGDLSKFGIKVVDRGCLHVNVEEKWSVQLSKKLLILFILYHICYKHLQTN